ncbi:ABC transporter permease [Rathayibacter sp. CAU 1779]
MALFTRLIIQRILLLIPLLLGVILFVFIVMRFSGADPAIAALAGQGGNPTPQQIEQFRHDNGLDQPLIVQYVYFVGDVFRGNLGYSLLNHQPVTQIIATALPLTLQLTGLGIVVAVVLALLLGITGALFRDRWPDKAIRVVTLAFVAAPSFWVALLLVQWFSVDLKIFPPSGYVNPQQDFGQFLFYMVLPMISLALPIAGALARIVRTSMVEELDRDYVRTAMGNGLPRIVVVGRNVLRNALINPLTVLGLQIGYLIGGAVIIETTFALPGMGQTMINSVINSDPFVVQGVVIVIAIGFVVVNMVVDILYLAVNPRLRSAAA